MPSCITGRVYPAKVNGSLPARAKQAPPAPPRRAARLVHGADQLAFQNPQHRAEIMPALEDLPVHPDDAWHGVVRRVADGHEETFHGAEQLLELMRTGAAPPPDDGSTGPVQRA